MWRWLLGIALLLGVALGVVFGALNPQSVRLNLVVVELNATLGTVVALAFSAGGILGFIAMGLLRLLHRPRRGGRASSTRSSTAKQDSIASDA